jgi:hypothetical protein
MQLNSCIRALRLLGHKFEFCMLAVEVQNAIQLTHSLYHLGAAYPHPNLALDIESAASHLPWCSKHRYCIGYLTCCLTSSGHSSAPIS